MRYSGKRWGVIGISAAMMVALGGVATSLRGANSNRSGKSVIEPSGGNEELLLVRSWNPKSGELIGWMPLHRVAITLQQVTPQPLSLDLNDAVSVKLPRRPGEFDTHSLHIAPEPVTFDGQKWLPLNREPNLVRIKKCLFYVKSIVFGESKYRKATEPRGEQ